MFIYFYLFIKNIYIVIPDFKTRCFYDIILFFFPYTLICSAAVDFATVELRDCDNPAHYKTAVALVACADKEAT